MHFKAMWRRTDFYGRIGTSMTFRSEKCATTLDSSDHTEMLELDNR